MYDRQNKRTFVLLYTMDLKLGGNLISKRPFASQTKRGAHENESLSTFNQQRVGYESDASSNKPLGKSRITIVPSTATASRLPFASKKLLTKIRAAPSTSKPSRRTKTRRGEGSGVMINTCTIKQQAQTKVNLLKNLTK